jgi:hypothetical protein
MFLRKTKIMGCLVLVLLSINILKPAFATVIRSDMPSRSDLFKQGDSVIFWNPSLSTGSSKSITSNPRPTAFTELTPYVLPSPDQDEAGSCLYMAVSGIAEWWLAKLHPKAPIISEGIYDLSERYLMGVAGIDEDRSGLSDWRTDTVYLFNSYGNKSLRNTAYRFTKGWYKGESYSDNLLPAAPNEVGAAYGTLYNWINEIPSVSREYVSLPTFKREIIFADPAHNQWNIGVTPNNIVDVVKQTLIVKKAPVLVIYNHNSYWHAVYIIGYDDYADHKKCAYTENFRLNIAKRAAELQKSADEAVDPVVKEAYTIRAKRAIEAKAKIENTYTQNGGCTSLHGGFLIRDSIYPDQKGPIYDYDLANQGEESPYSKKIVIKEYDWLRYFANHISVITTDTETSF